MGFSFTVKFDKAEKIAANISKRVRQQVEKEVENVIHKGALRIEAEAVNNVAVNQGELRNSIGTKMSKQGSVIRAEIFAAAPYAPYIEFGTRPHKAPFNAIKAYAASKGKEDEWFLFWLGIMRNGTKAQPFMGPAFYKNETWIRNNVRQAIRKGLKGGR